MSRIVAIMPARNEAWILGLSARALLLWVDHLIICQHCCTDATPDIVSALIIEYGPERVSSITDDDSTWHERAMRQRLLEGARMVGGTHVVIIDADEVVTGNLLPKIRAWVETTSPGYVLQLPWLQLRGSINQVISTEMWAHQDASISFRDDPAWCWKATNGYDHHHRHPMGKPFMGAPALTPGNRTGGLMHLQMSSLDRLLWKQLWYKCTEKSRWPSRMSPAALNAMYDQTAIGHGCLQTVPDNWWQAYRDAGLMRYIDVEAEPWQKAEVLRMLAENPRLADGLTTYGLEVCR